MSANHTTKKPNRKTPGPGESGRRANRKRVLTLAVILIAAAGILFAHKGDEIQNLIQSKGIHAEAGVAKAGYKSGGLSPKNLSDQSIRKTVPIYSGQGAERREAGISQIGNLEESLRATGRSGPAGTVHRHSSLLGAGDYAERRSAARIHQRGSSHGMAQRAVPKRLRRKPVQPLPPNRLAADGKRCGGPQPDYRHPVHERGRDGAFRIESGRIPSVHRKPCDVPRDTCF